MSLRDFLIRFLDPSQFDAEDLQERYEELDEDRVREIHAMLRPRFLRRTKADVLTFLPPKSEIIIPLSMSSVQKELYKSIVSQNSDLMKAITTRVEKGQQMSKTTGPKLQNILMQLRKCLAHPFVQAPELEDRTVSPEQEQRALIEASGKLSFLAKILPKLKERGHRILIFSQFLDMLDLLEEFLRGCGMKFGRLDGNTATVDRQHMIDDFNAAESDLDCFLLSTRAGGAGINLGKSFPPTLEERWADWDIATADTVIIYDPDFNPHQDMQALARVHRIGQEKKVLVFRLMTRNTVEGT
jgi:chromodomain-helicase-DNA-binding protein 4